MNSSELRAFPSPLLFDIARNESAQWESRLLAAEELLDRDDRRALHSEIARLINEVLLNRAKPEEPGANGVINTHGSDVSCSLNLPYVRPNGEPAQAAELIKPAGPVEVDSAVTPELLNELLHNKNLDFGGFDFSKAEEAMEKSIPVLKELLTGESSRPIHEALAAEGKQINPTVMAALESPNPVGALKAGFTTKSMMQDESIDSTARAERETDGLDGQENPALCRPARDDRA